MDKGLTWNILIQLEAVKGEMPSEGKWNLRRINLSGANLYKADLSEANLYKADLYKANLYKTDLYKANLSETNLREANLREANLRFANLRFANLSKADFYKANLSGANLSGADLLGANLSGADLREADLSLAKLISADLSRVDLRKADLRKAKLFSANISKADLSEADLREADLSKANLSASILIKANLANAILSGVCLDDTILLEWIIEEVICTHILKNEGGIERIISFHGGEFEKRYTHINQIIELMLSIPFTGATSIIADFITQSINNLKESFIMSVKGIEAMSDSDTRLTFLVFDHDFIMKNKEVFETTLRNALNDYFTNDLPNKYLDNNLDPLNELTKGVIKFKKGKPLPGTGLEINAPVLEDLALLNFKKMGKIGQDIGQIIYSVFK